MKKHLCQIDNYQVMKIIDSNTELFETMTINQIVDFINGRVVFNVNYALVRTRLNDSNVKYQLERKIKPQGGVTIEDLEKRIDVLSYHLGRLVYVVNAIVHIQGVDLGQSDDTQVDDEIPVMLGDPAVRRVAG